jgi:hypothetical protein
MKKILIAVAIALSSVTAAHAESPSNVTQYKERLKPDSIWGKDKERINKYNLEGMLANNPFSPGVKQDVMLQALQNIHDNRPAVCCKHCKIYTIIVLQRLVIRLEN